MVIWLKWSFMKVTVRKAQCGNVQNVEESLRKKDRKVHNIVHFAASKKHIGFYPGPVAVEEFDEALKGYKTDKGTIRIPYGKVDAELIKRIVLWCYETGNHA